MKKDTVQRADKLREGSARTDTCFPKSPNTTDTVTVIRQVTKRSKNKKVCHVGGVLLIVPELSCGSLVPRPDRNARLFSRGGTDILFLVSSAGTSVL